MQTTLPSAGNRH